MTAAEQLITQHDLWTAAVKRRSTAARGPSTKVELYGIRKLRELILELAVRGLLVPQDPNDEPAGKLLLKIAGDKADLVKRGRIKKEKPLPPVGEDEKAFDTPVGWEWARLQDVSEYIQRGKSPIYAEAGRVRVVSQKCIQWAGFDLAASRFVDDASLSSYKEERFLRTQDLVWNSTGTGTVGRANVLRQIPEKALVADSHVTVVRMLGVNGEYFCTYICSPIVQRRIEPTHEASLVSGSTQQVELNTSAVILLPVPVPPLNEQHRIVAKVEELMALCDQLEQQTEGSLSAHENLVATLLNALTSAADHTQFARSWQRIAEHFDALFTTEDSIDQLKQTILKLAVMGKLVPQDPNDEPASELLKKMAAQKSRLVKDKIIRGSRPLSAISDKEQFMSLPAGWSFARLNDVGDWGAGATPSRNNPELYGGGIPWFKSGELIADYISQAEETVTELAMEKCSLRYNRVGDVLIAMYGATIGKTSILSVPATTNQAVCACTPFLGFENKYLLTLLKAYKPRFVAMGAGGAQPNISREKIIETVVAVPPTAEQHRIVAQVDNLMVLCQQLSSRLSSSATIQVFLADAVTKHTLARAW